MADNNLWKQLLTPSALKSGWHLARNDMRNDFVDDRFFSDAVANNFDRYIAEILRLLQTNQYRFHPLVSIDVPKSGLAVRPGSVLHIADRIVLFAAIKLLVPIFDKYLPDSVYSYRYKSDDKHTLFRESDVLDIPFLKKRTIQKYFEPFDPWYALWPLFDEESKGAIFEGYNHLVVSDIAAYFENINLEILRSLLYSKMPSEQRIINLLVDSLESWAVQTENGFRPRRGIPQGSAISSFVGNIFLLPLDESFEEMKSRQDIRYFRYMDDIRIFCKDTSIAREMVFKLDATIRKLHLNLQGAKTKILREVPDKKISEHLIDSRLDYLKAMREEFQSSGRQFDKVEWRTFRERLWSLAKAVDNWEGFPKLVGQTRPHSGLSLRVFRMWITLLRDIGDADFLRFLLRELALNPDHRLTKAFVNGLRRFPKRTKFVPKILAFLRSPLNIFAHQAAELIGGLRYMTRLNTDVRTYALERLLDREEHFYIRIQCCLLMARFSLTTEELRSLVKLSTEETDEMLLTGLFIPLAQLAPKRCQSNLGDLLHHPNERVRILAGYVSRLISEPKVAKSFLQFALDEKNEMRLCDYIGYVWYLAASPDRNILEHLLEKTDVPSKKHRILDLRERLGDIRQRAKNQIELISSTTVVPA